MRDRCREVGDSDVYASDAESKEYRGSSYIPTTYDNLDVALETDAYPDRGRDGGAYRVLDLPRVPELSKVLGPSAIMLGASLGSGETLFWPSLIAEHGWALYWAFFVGVVTQFFINTEIQRWTLATGESVFRAFERSTGSGRSCFSCSGSSASAGRGGRPAPPRSGPSGWASNRSRWNSRV